MPFFERLGEVAVAALIVLCVWLGGKVLVRVIEDLPPVCMSIGGGCQ